MKNGKHPEEIADNLVYTDEEYLVREEKAGTMESYVVSESILFVTGEKDPNNDADWNNFLDTLKELGRDELMKVCQSAYSRK
jgi:putative aldouronate transport system substrate-binding protein